MTRQTKVLAVLFFASFSIFFYLALSSHIAFIRRAEKGAPPAPVDQPAGAGSGEIGDVHWPEMSKIMADYAALVDAIKNEGGGDGSSSADAYAAGDKDNRDDFLRRTEELKTRISGLKAPDAGYKDLHLNLILSVSSMENFLKGGGEEEKENGLRFLAEARNDFSAMPESAR